MAEYVRNCAGGVAFAGEDVFLLKTDTGAWIMPNGVIRDRRDAREIALYRVEAEAGIRAEIVAFVGRTCYDFFSRSRRREVSNRIQWFAMRAPDRRYRVAFEQGFLDGGYYPCEAAMRLLTHEQDREILRRAREIVAAPAADG